MKKVLCSLLVLMFIFTTRGQEPAFTWSQPLTKPGHPIDVQVMGYSADGYFMVNKKAPSGMEFSPTIQIDHLNAKQEKTFTRDVTPERIEDFVNVVYFNNSLCVIKSLFSKETGKNVLSAVAFGRDGRPAPAVELAAQAAEKLSKRGRFEVAASPDGSKLLVLSMPEFVKDENEKITITLYGAGMKKIWSAEQTFSYTWTRAVENTPYVNNNGTAFLLKKTDMKGNDNTYSIFSFDGTALKEFKIALDGNKKIFSMAQGFTPEGHFTVGGYYTEDKKVKIGFMGNALQGSFLYRVAASGATAAITAVNAFEKRHDVIARNLLFHNGNTILVGEWYGVNSKSASKPGDAFARDYTYSGNDIYIDGFDAAGKPLYGSTIKKRNESVNDNGALVSYFASMIKGKLHVIFNDDKSNHDGKKNIVVFGSTKIIVYATVDPLTGAVAETQAVSNTGPVGGKGAEMNLRPDVFLRADDTHCIMRAENNEKYRMAMVGF
jgi:hypothetical protein